jgi:hypothetical protein
LASEVSGDQAFSRFSTGVAAPPPRKRSSAADRRAANWRMSVAVQRVGLGEVGLVAYH